MLAIPAPANAAAGDFCWLDLAATDAAAARRFYRDLFGWTARERPANGGHFTRLQHAGRDIGSLYQLSSRLVESGAHSHWLPYVRVGNIEDAARRTAQHGGQVLVRPFDVDGIARIALVRDAVGAQLGLWQPIERTREAPRDG
jgi:predicted enzyme related to lactoylglutathione lyase